MYVIHECTAPHTHTHEPKLHILTVFLSWLKFQHQFFYISFDLRTKCAAFFLSYFGLLRAWTIDRDESITTTKEKNRHLSSIFFLPSDSHAFDRALLTTRYQATKKMIWNECSHVCVCVDNWNNYKRSKLRAFYCVRRWCTNVCCLLCVVHSKRKSANKSRTIQFKSIKIWFSIRFH